jgi:hypothetical protein
VEPTTTTTTTTTTTAVLLAVCHQMLLEAKIVQGARFARKSAMKPISAGTDMMAVMHQTIVLQTVIAITWPSQKVGHEQDGPKRKIDQHENRLLRGRQEGQIGHVSSIIG